MNISEVLAKEAEIKEIIDRIKHDITERIKEMGIPGVTKITSSPGICMVSFSQVANNGCNLSAEFYMADAQADIVCKSFANADTAGKLQNKLNEIINSRQVVINKQKYSVRPEVINILTDYL